MASRNQKQRERLRRQRQRMVDELSYYTNNTFAEEDQETVAREIRLLKRALEQQGVPSTYK